MFVQFYFQFLFGTTASSAAVQIVRITAFLLCLYFGLCGSSWFILPIVTNNSCQEKRAGHFRENPSKMADDSWRTPAFRTSVVSKIDEAIRLSGMNTSKNSSEMESHVFQKAKNKDEYLGYVARLILHVREMNTKKGQNIPGVVGPTGPGTPGMPDPINALTNLASQGTRQPMMGVGGPGQPMGGGQAPGGQPPGGGAASSLLQTLNSRGPVGPGGPGQGMMMGGMGGGMGMPGMGMPQGGGPMGGQVPGQMGGQMPMQMNPAMGPMGGQMQPGQMGAVPGGMQPGMQGGMIPGPMQGGMGGPMGPQMGNPMMGGQMMMGRGPAFPRQPTPGQMYGQSPSPSGGLGGQVSVPSPAMAASPGTQLMGGPQGGPRSVSLAPSPGSSLNTPAGQPGQSPIGGVGSAGGGSLTDEQAYREKVRQLSKYIEPLRKMVAKMGNEDVEKMSKMKKLLEILSNPQQRMPLDTLLKCEIVLEKIEFKRGEGVTTAPHLQFKEPHVFHSLLDAVSSNLQSPAINHTLHRTFRPTLDALFGPEIKLVAPLKNQKVEEPTSDIPDVLQGEIARLDQRFKVSLDPNQQPGSKSIQLICWLDDKHLPCVPPITLTIPEDYPVESPTCQMASHEYNATQFLAKVQTALEARIKKLPKSFSVSQLLDTWEMSVRQAASPAQIPVDTMTILMGL